MLKVFGKFSLVCLLLHFPLFLALRYQVSTAVCAVGTEQFLSYVSFAIATAQHLL